MIEKAKDFIRKVIKDTIYRTKRYVRVPILDFIFFLEKDIKDLTKKVSIKTLLDNMNPQTVVDILATHHVVAWTVNILCLVAVILSLIPIMVVVTVCAINWGLCWGIYTVLFGCPLNPGEALYRQKAGLGEAEDRLVYVRNLITRLVRRVRDK